MIHLSPRNSPLFPHSPKHEDKFYTVFKFILVVIKKLILSVIACIKVLSLGGMVFALYAVLILASVRPKYIYSLSVD